MNRLLITALLMVGGPAFGGKVPASLSEWVATEKKLTQDEWFAANNHGTTWDVYLEKDQVKVRPYKFGRDTGASLKLSDGCLVSDNRGEFGATLFWKSNDGRKAKLSEDPIEQFIQVDSRILAISGLAHGGTNEGEVLELKRKGGDWKISRIAKLKDAPIKAIREAKTRLLVLTYSSLSRVSLDGGTKRIVPKGDWDGLIPRSLVMDGKGFAYVGFSQRVAKVDLKTGNVIYLVPSSEIFAEDLKTYKKRYR
ncbi:MAG TPA: hypothetical protein VM940_16495 [Chthoniobacterales bacterium]|jgi:hypothetical protein|nr:hypothetical protein [Chthoniobacterales bacterium]